MGESWPVCDGKVLWDGSRNLGVSWPVCDTKVLWDGSRNVGMSWPVCDGTDSWDGSWCTASVRTLCGSSCLLIGVQGAVDGSVAYA